MLLFRRSVLFVACLLLISGTPSAAPLTVRATSVLPTPAPLMTTLAGPSYGLDGTGQAASFSQPQGMALSDDGRFALIADTSSHTIRRIDLRTRLVTTIAGLAGSRGSVDGSGSAARFDAPTRIRISRDGSFALVLEGTDPTWQLRRIDLASGQVTTLGEIAFPRGQGMGISPDGARAWIVKYDFAIEADALFAIDTVTGTATSFAPLTLISSELLTNIAYFALSRDGSFALIAARGADFGSSQQIWRLDMQSKALTLVSGTSAAPCSREDGSAETVRFCSINGLAISADGSFALVNDERSVRRVNLSDGSTIWVAGGYWVSVWKDGVGKDAAFHVPYDLAISSDGQYALLLDRLNYHLRRISLVAEGPNPPYTVSTLAGQLPSGVVDGIGQVARFGNLRALALSGDGRFALVADHDDDSDLRDDVSRLRRIQVQEGEVAIGTTTTLLTTPDLISALAISRDGQSGLMLAGSRLWRLDLRTTPPTQTLVAGSETSGNADGIGAAAQFGGSVIRGFDNSNGLAISADEQFALLADTENGAVRKIVLATGEVTTLADTIAVGDLAISPDGTYALIGDPGIGPLRRLDLTTGEVTTIGPHLFYSAVTISADGRYALIAGDFNSLIRLDTATWEYETLAVTLSDGSFALLPRITLSSDGRFALLLDQSTYTIRRLGTPVPDTTVSTLAGQAGSMGSQDGAGFGARFTLPSAVAMSDTGIALLADSGSHTLRRVIVSNGDIFTIAGQADTPGSADGSGATSQLNTPAGVAIDRIATFGIVADTLNHTIRRIDLRSGELTTIAGQPGAPGSADGSGAEARFDKPTGVALVCSNAPLNVIDPVTDCPYAFIADTGNRTIRKLVLATNEVTTIAGMAGSAGFVDGAGSASRFSRPTGLSAAYGGAFAVVVDEGNRALRRIDLATNTVSTLTQSLPIAAARPATYTDLPSLDVVIGCGAGTLMVANSADHTIIEVDPDSGAQRMIAGAAGELGAADGSGAQARFNGPRGIGASCYENGSAIVGDTDNFTARELNAKDTRVYLPFLQ